MTTWIVAWLLALAVMAAIFGWALCRMGKIEPPLPGCSDDELCRRHAREAAQRKGGAK